MTVQCSVRLMWQNVKCGLVPMCGHTKTVGMHINSVYCHNNLFSMQDAHSFNTGNVLFIFDLKCHACTAGYRFSYNV